MLTRHSRRDKPEVRQHVARSADFMKKGQDAKAEQEYRAAIHLDPQNADLWASLSDALGSQLKWDDAISAAREAVRLDPSNDTAHVYLGIALRENAPCGIRSLIEDSFKAAKVGRSEQVDVSAYDCRKADFSESISEFREAIRLNPDNEWAHYQLGLTLDRTDNPDAGAAEFREALSLNPNYASAHFALGSALGQKGDLDGAIIEMRAAVRLDVTNAYSHERLAQYLEKRGEQEEALSEYREAYTLEPFLYKGAYEDFLQKVNAARQQQKLRHWLGTWVFGGPVKVIFSCAGGAFDAFDTTNYPPSFTLLAISPSGQVSAQVEHPLKAGENEAESIRNPKPDWFGTATETSLVLTMDTIPPGTVLSSSKDRLQLKDAAGRLEAHREGERYSVVFTYFYSFSSQTGDCESTAKFSGGNETPVTWSLHRSVRAWHKDGCQ